MSAKKIYFPKIRLSELLAAPGGLARDDAVASAIHNVQAISQEGDAAMEAAIQAIGKLLAGAGPRLDPALLQSVLLHADQIVTLAGTFGYDFLDRAARSLCDTIENLQAANLSDTAPVAVHADAMRLFAPGKKTPVAAAEGVLDELNHVRAHYQRRA